MSWTLAVGDSRAGVARLRPRASELADRTGLAFTLSPTLGDAGSCDGRVEVLVGELTTHLSIEAPTASVDGWHRVCPDDGCSVAFRLTNDSRCTAPVMIEAFVFDEERGGPSCEGDLSSSSITIE